MRRLLQSSALFIDFIQRCSHLGHRTNTPRKQLPCSSRLFNDASSCPQGMRWSDPSQLMNYRLYSNGPVISVPGMDGVTYPLLNSVSNVSLQCLCAMANALFHGQPLPDGEPMLCSILLPKKGDLSNLGNYCPLSIAAATFRILGAAIADWLQDAVQEVISPTQTGFILGHHSARNVTTLYLLQHAVATGAISDTLWVLNLDQQKAYD